MTKGGAAMVPVSSCVCLDARVSARRMSKRSLTDACGLAKKDAWEVRTSVF